MSRKIFQTSKFNGGMILNADPSDLTEGFGVVAMNTMSSLDSGMIGGRYDDTGSGIAHVYQYGYIFDGATHHLVSLDTNGTLFVDGEFIDWTEGKCITAHRNYSLIGRGPAHLPMYEGYPNGSTSLVLCENNMSPDYIANVVEVWPGTPFLNDGEIVYYGAAIVYDGYMYGPMKKLATIPALQPNLIWEGTDLGPQHLMHIRLTLSLDFGANFAMAGRVTKVVLYRSVSQPGTVDANQASEYTAVAEFTDTSSMVFHEGTGIDLGATHGGVLEAYTPVIGNSYRNQSELDDTAPYCMIGYTCAYEMNNFLFVGNVGYAHTEDGVEVQDFPDGARLLYRSLRGKHSQFNVLSDYLSLPFTPIVITSFNARLLVFGSAEFAIVNPESMTVEDIIHGYGIESSLCVHTTLSGVFFANRNNMYVYEGTQIIPIGTPLLRMPSDALISFIHDMKIFTYEEVVKNHGGVVKILHSARVNSILFMYSVDGEAYAFVFSLDSKVWSVFSFGALEPAAGYTDRSNNLFISDVGAMASDEKYVEWKYITKRMNLGNDGQAKKIYAIKSSSSLRSADITHSFNGGSFGTGLVRRIQNVVVKYEPSEENGILTGLEITYREMLNIK
jgi:hypothetical protein